MHGISSVLVERRLNICRGIFYLFILCLATVSYGVFFYFFNVAHLSCYDLYFSLATILELLEDCGCLRLLLHFCSCHHCWSMCSLYLCKKLCLVIPQRLLSELKVPKGGEHGTTAIKLNKINWQHVCDSLHCIGIVRQQVTWGAIMSLDCPIYHHWLRVSPFWWSLFIKRQFVDYSPNERSRIIFLLLRLVCHQFMFFLIK